MSFDLVVKGGTCVTASEMFEADIGIKDGRIAALGEGLNGEDVIDARGNIDDFRGDRDPGVVGSWLARQVAIEHRLRYAINKLRREGYPSDEITAAITRILGETDGAE